MIKVTRWSPDTCGCKIEYEWDTELDGLQRVHTWVNTVRTCAAHTAHSGPPLYVVVHEENTRKNWMLGILEASFPEMPKGGEQYAWSFDADRVLHVQLPKGTTGTQRNQMKAAADIQFGPGLVVLDG